MSLSQRNNRWGEALSAVLTLLCLLTAAGSKLWFHACPVQAGARIMPCHWAEQAVFATAVVMTLQSVLLFVLTGDEARMAVSLSILPEAVLLMLYPGTLISLCMMPTMRCHTVMRPAVLVLAALIFLAAAASAAFHRRRAVRAAGQ